MVRATTAAPCFFASPQIRSRFFPPSSRLMEFMRHFPGWILSASSMQSGEVESITVGTRTDWANRRVRAARSTFSSLPA
jgi:hypothetical protein